MSNFNCDKCGLANLDSPEGYTSGCGHNKPERDGMYNVGVQMVGCQGCDSTKELKDGAWKITSLEKIVWWSVIR